MIKANNPKLKSWIEVGAGNDFPIQNLPYGIFSTRGTEPRAGVAIGDHVLDLAALDDLGFFKDLSFDKSVFKKDTLNDFIALGKPVCRAVRNRLSELMEEGNAELRDHTDARAHALLKKEDVVLHIPVKIGNYTDFYSSIEHAVNVGSMFRDPENALLPNWKHLPVGYHGRASSIIVSGTNIHRPKGQTKADDVEMPSFGPTQLLDFELELAFITGKNNPLGSRLSTVEAEEYIFGMALFNDWSARDIQKWEYVPLGPFLSKSFASSISPWVVTLDALEPFRTDGPEQNPKVLPYLEFEGRKNYDIELEVYIQPEQSVPKRVCKSNFKYMYWNMCQQLAHQTANGCNVQVGDLYASGTISGPDPGSFGSMLELTWRGTKPIKMANGSERKFINDGDTVTMKGYAEKNGVRVGFGEVSAKVLPAV